jgi:hypothetical protein
MDQEGQATQEIQESKVQEQVQGQGQQQLTPQQMIEELNKFIASESRFAEELITRTLRSTVKNIVDAVATVTNQVNQNSFFE